MTKKYDWLIVGAGFTGAVLAERIATQLNKRVLVIDRRNHIAGNAYDYPIDSGILVHKYGPHIFHTNSEKVWSYLSRFTSWRPYFHHVLASVEGQLVPIPFNLVSIERLFPAHMAETLSKKLIEKYGFGQKVPILKMREQDDPDLIFLADYVYENVFKHYTIKQWALRPEDLDAGVTARVPLFVSKDSRYFQDKYQAMPNDGYTALFKRMLDHPNIDISLETEFSDAETLAPDAKVVFTGPVDEYFKYEHGPLPYRSLRFDLVERDYEQDQAVGTVNYPNQFDFTRVTELKHLTGQRGPKTALIYEYPEAYTPGSNEPYYPIPTADTAELLRPYQEMTRALHGKVFFAGRLGDYAYYNMDQACARALSMFDKTISKLT